MGDPRAATGPWLGHVMADTIDARVTAATGAAFFVASWAPGVGSRLEGLPALLAPPPAAPPAAAAAFDALTTAATLCGLFPIPRHKIHVLNSEKIEMLRWSRTCACCRRARRVP
jgi:hypothetical protein